MWMLSAVVALVLLVLVAACSSESSKTRRLGALTYDDRGTKLAQGKTALELEADSNYFEPTFVQGDPDNTVRLTLKNDANITHSFSITGEGTDKDIPAKGGVSITVAIPASGAAPFFCEFHTAQGMNGQFLADNAQPWALSRGPVPAAMPASSSSGYRGD